MFWDAVAFVYDIFADGINRKANRALCAAVEPLIAPADEVLECACGTGLLTGVIAPPLQAADRHRPVRQNARAGKKEVRQIPKRDLCAGGYHAPCLSERAV